MFENRTGQGFVYGVVATIAMSIPMVIATVTGVSPMPEPIPKALVVTFFGGAPKPVVMILAVGGHLAYGGLFGALLARVARPVTLVKALTLAVSLWGFMQAAILPTLGWGVFGHEVTTDIAVATLLLHLVYGVVLGWTLNRNLPEFDAGMASATS